MTQSLVRVALLASIACAAPMPTTSSPSPPHHDLIGGEVDLELADVGRHGSDAAPVSDGATTLLRLAMQGCYTRALLAAPTTHGWLAGEIVLDGASTSMHVNRSVGLPPELLDCVVDACTNVPVTTDAAWSTHWTLFASLR